MGTNGVSQANAKAQDGFLLLQQRKALKESADKQTAAIQEAVKQMQADATKAGTEVKNMDKGLAQKIMILSNFTITEAPDPGNEKYQLEVIDKTTGEKTKTLNQKEFDVAKAEFEKYKALEKEVKKETEALGIKKEDFEKLTKAAQDKEKELNEQKGVAEKAKIDYDFSLEKYEEIQQDLERAEFEVKLKNKGDNLTKVAAESLDGVRTDEAKGDKKLLGKTLMEVDAAEGSSNSAKVKGDKHGANHYYTHMAEGSSHKYSFEEMQKMGKAYGVDMDMSDDFEISSKDINDLVASQKPEGDGEVLGGASSINGDGGAAAPVNPKKEEAKPENPNDKYHVGNLTLPRGGATNHGKDASSLEALDLQENPNGTYTDTKSGQVYSASELNTMFRGMESGVDPDYPKLLDKAEKLGLDIDAITKGDTSKQAVDDLKAAIDAKEKADKAAKKQAKKDKKAAKEVREAEEANKALDIAKDKKVGSNYKASVKDSDAAKKALDKYSDEINEMKADQSFKLTDDDLASMTADQIKDLVKKYKAAKKESKQADKAQDKADNYRKNKSTPASENLTTTLNSVTTNGFNNLPSVIKNDAKIVLGGGAEKITGSVNGGAYSISRSGSDSIIITYKGNKIKISADEV